VATGGIAPRREKKPFLLFRKAGRAKRVELTAARRQNAAVQLQAVSQKARGSAPFSLHFKEANCDGYPNGRA
jgi:hypothetical protein